jgi:tetratricopeptide (TPR) repeat protein
MRALFRLALLGGACVALASCASERLLNQSGPTPAWAVTLPEATEQDLLFVGVSVGRNVLDEREMRDRAMEHAREQAATQIAASVEAETTEYLRETGYGPAGEDEVKEAEYVRRVGSRVAQEIHGVRQEEAYHEKWRVDPGLLSRSFIRYRYYVLAAYPREEYERKLRKYVRLAEDPYSARQLINEGKADEAARLLEQLLSDYPDAPAAPYLTLADAYERGARLDEAASTLRVALERSSADEEARVRQRLEHMEGAFPDLTGRTALALVTFGGELLEAGARPAWAEEPFVAAGVKTLEVSRRDSGMHTERDVERARAGGAEWLVELHVAGVPGERAGSVYGMEVARVCVESTARVFGTADGALLASASRRDCRSARDEASALEPAARQSIRAAMRACFLEVAGSN